MPSHKHYVVDRYRNDPIYHAFVHALASSIKELRLTTIELDGAIELCEDINREKVQYQYKPKESEGA